MKTPFVVIVGFNNIRFNAGICLYLYTRSCIDILKEINYTIVSQVTHPFYEKLKRNLFRR